MKNNLDKTFFSWLRKQEILYPARIYLVFTIIIFFILMLILRVIISKEIGLSASVATDYSFVWNIIIVFFVVELWFFIMLIRRPSNGWRMWRFN